MVAVVPLLAISSVDKSKEPPSFIKKLTGDREFGRGAFSNLPECDGQQYTVPIVDVDEINSITPLGNLNPPEHTTPTNHMYIDVGAGGATLKAPGDIVLTSISSSYNAQRGTTDYSIDFSLCKDLHGYFLHIKTLVPELEGLLSEKNCEVYGDGGKFKNCWSRIEKDLKAGDIIGTVGNSQQGNFDFGTYDLRERGNFVNPDRYGDKTPYIVCPLDYYAGVVKDQLKNKLERSTDPICGQIDYDIPGTLQGNWFFGDAREDTPGDWDKNLVFAYSNYDPSVAVISIGGVFTKASTYSFIPKGSGLINRSFNTITNDGNIYCFESDSATKSESKSNSGKILVEMVSDTKIKIESQSSGCSGSDSLVKPVTYER